MKLSPRNQIEESGLRVGDAAGGLVIFLFLVLLLSSCSPGNKEPRIRRIVLPVASKTDRSHILTESVIILHAHNFTIQYADSRRNQSAMRTDWRMLTETVPLASGEEEAIELRDRVILHLSPRGVQSNRATTLVSSSLEFEMQLRVKRKDEWVDIAPNPRYREEYDVIVSSIQSRLRKRGYVFD